MKIAYLILSLLFLVFLLFQTNDPGTPWIWMILYGYASLISFLMFTGSVKHSIWLVLGIIVYIFQAIYSWPRSFDGMQNSMTIMRPEIETARETLGMVLCAVVMIFYVVMLRRNRVTSAVL